MKIFLLIGAVGLLIFFAITSLAPFRNTLFSGLFPKYSSNASGNPSISLLPGITVSTGQTFTTPVMIDTDGNDILSADINLSFDKTVLQLTDITPHPENSLLKDFLPQDGSVTPAIFDKTNIMASANSNGVINFGALTEFSQSEPAGFNGILDQSKPLATLQFKALTNSPTTVTVSYSPNSTNDSNLVRWDGVDILSKVTNLAINGGQTASPTPTATPTTKQINITNFSYQPNNITANIGDSITWTNNDTVPHTVTADINNAFTSGTIQPGQTYTLTVSTSGTFAYHCNFHPSMTGTITVTSPSSQPQASTKPGDIDNNNLVNIFDHNTLLTDFAKTQSPADIAPNNKVDIFDYNLLLFNFSK